MSCDAWFELSDCGGGVVGGQQYTSTQCAVQALMIDDQHALAWLNLGTSGGEFTGGTGGGLVAGQQHSSAQCYIKALEIDNQNTEAWVYLGTSGGLVAGQQHSEAQCYINALEIDNQNTDVSNRNTIHFFLFTGFL